MSIKINPILNIHFGTKPKKQETKPEEPDEATLTRLHQLIKEIDKEDGTFTKLREANRPLSRVFAPEILSQIDEKQVNAPKEEQ